MFTSFTRCVRASLSLTACRRARRGRPVLNRSQHDSLGEAKVSDATSDRNCIAHVLPGSFAAGGRAAESRFPLTDVKNVGNGDKAQYLSFFFGAVKIKCSSHLAAFNTDIRHLISHCKTRINFRRCRQLYSRLLRSNVTLKSFPANWRNEHAGSFTVSVCLISVG